MEILKEKPNVSNSKELDSSVVIDFINYTINEIIYKKSVNDFIDTETVKSKNNLYLNICQY